MSELLIRPDERPAADGTALRVTPESAGWYHVGFELCPLGPGESLSRAWAEHELCLVVVEGSADVSAPAGEWSGVGGRENPFEGAPGAVYLPPHGELRVTARDEAEIALCWAPARRGAEARLLESGNEVERRGYDVHERWVRDILMGDEEAESLLVCEVVTPSGHWSSYPPHKHDRDALPEESLLEETYYHRVSPANGFALQRVYSDDRALDETVAVHDRDLVLVPRGYHAVAAPPGVASYYLNVMAGPSRSWAFVDDPALAWTRAPGATTDLPIPKEPR